MPRAMEPIASSPAPDRASLRGMLLGASVALSVGVLGVCVPALAMVNRWIFQGLDMPMPRPTALLAAAGPWTLAMAALALVGVVVAAHRLSRGRATRIAPTAALLLVLLVCTAAGLSVIMPLVRMGEAMAGA